MGDGKKQQSIRAARDWLEEADASLSEGSDIRGDLKVMLAQAELRHVQESEPTKHQLWRRRLTHLLPLTAAAVLAALAFYLTPAVAPPQETAGVQAPPAEMQVQPATEDVAGTPATAGATDVTDDAGDFEPVTSAPEREPDRTAMAQAPAAVVAKELVVPAQEQSAVTANQPAQAAQSAATPAVPAPETQKLMQSAGKALREP